MSSNKNRTSEEDDSGSGSSTAVVGGIAAVVGVALGAGLAYFFGGSDAGPQCNTANSYSDSGTSSASSSTFRNRPQACEACTVCLDPVGGITVLPCTHRFHTSCINPWLSKTKTCPTCRAPAPDNLVRHY